jgi:hypothetical protein
MLETFFDGSEFPLGDMEAAGVGALALSALPATAVVALVFVPEAFVLTTAVLLQAENVKASAATPKIKSAILFIFIIFICFR